MTLTLIDKAFLLKKTLLFSALDIDHLLTVADKMETESYKKGASVFQKNQTASRLYFIVDGVIGANGAKITAPDFFGEESLLCEKPRAYDALCLTDATLLSLSDTHLFAILNELPTVAIALLEAYANQTPFRER